MKQQVFVIHGGNAFRSYEDYLEHLRTKEIDLECLQRNDWKAHLSEQLGEGFQVIFPSMPNKQNAQYLEWKIWLERFIPFFSDGVILIGHSLGGCFLAKYLSEERFPKEIKAAFLVAAPYDLDQDRNLKDFVVPKSLEGFERQVEKIVVYQSKDDHVVRFSEAGKYQRALSNAEIIFFEDRGHFNQEEFPELVEAIKVLSL